MSCLRQSRSNWAWMIIHWLTGNSFCIPIALFWLIIFVLAVVDLRRGGFEAPSSILRFTALIRHWPFGWKCSVTDVMKVYQLGCCDLSRTSEVRVEPRTAFRGCSVSPPPSLLVTKTNKCCIFWMLHAPVAAVHQHGQWSVVCSCVGKYYAGGSGSASCGGFTQSRPSWYEPKHILCVTVHTRWQGAWPTAVWVRPARP